MERREELESYKRSELFKVAKKYNLKGLIILSKNKIIEKILKAAEKLVKEGKKTPEVKSKPKSKAPAEKPQTARPARVPDETYQAQETKFYAPEARHQEFPKDTGFQLPSGYGDNRIVLMVRDPWWLYAYWEITSQKVQEIKNSMGGLANKAKLILRVYDVTDLNFTGFNAWRSFDIEISGGAANWYVSVGNGNRSYVVDLGLLAETGAFYLIARSNYVTTPREGISDVIDEEWMTVDFHKLYALAAGFGRNVGSEALKEMMERRLKEELASGRIASWGEKAEKKRSFWLVADAELIVYGATEPGATLTVQGRQIPLRKDGTFTLRYSLPDGRQEIPIAALSPDGEESRTITPIVERQTK